MIYNLVVLCLSRITQRTEHRAGHIIRTYSVNACRLNNDHFLREMPSASSRAAVLGILTADITDLPIIPPLPHVSLKSCQGGANIKVTPADAGKVLQVRAIGGTSIPVPAGFETLRSLGGLPYWGTLGTVK